MMVLASIAPMNLTGSHWGQILFEVNFELLYAIDFKPTLLREPSQITFAFRGG